MGSLVCVDGGFATTLMRAGLPPHTAASTWLHSHTAQVLAVHRAFVQAGCEVICTNTLCCVQVEDFAFAVQVARRAEPSEVWLSLGEGTSIEPAVFAGAPDAVLLETFVHPERLLEAVKNTAAHFSGLIVASLTPNSEGDLFYGGSAEPWLRRFRGAGAGAVGFNCGKSPLDVFRAISKVEGDDLFACPVGGAELPQVWADLANQVKWLGGCCGVAPEHYRWWP